MHELAFANTNTAKELAATFWDAHSRLARIYGEVSRELASTEVALKKRKAVLTLDVIPDKAKEKGLTSSRSPTGSEDIREAFYYTDDEFVAIKESLGALEAVKEMLEIKLTSLRGAAETAKRMIGEWSPDKSLNNPKPAEDGDYVILDEPAPKTDKPSRWGKFKL